MPSVTVWLNAFIPKDVPSYTRVLTAGPHKGKTAVPLPLPAYAANYKDWDAGYLTDQRGFDDSPRASVRMQSLAQVDLDHPSLFWQQHRSSGTTEVNLATGAQTGFKVAQMDRCRFREVPRLTGWLHKPYSDRLKASIAALVEHRRTTPSTMDYLGEVTLRLVGAANDPLVRASADIDYEGTFVFSGGRMPNSVDVMFDGYVDTFPAFECYASFRGKTKPLFTLAPPKGNTVMNLPGVATRSIRAGATFF